MNDFLTQDKRHLKLFQDNIVIDKRLLKWRRAEDGIKKTEVIDNNNINSNIGTFFIDSSLTTPDNTSVEEFDPDRDLNAATKWLPLYETPEGIKFDDLASAGIRDLTRLIVEKKIKYVMAGYGSLGNTIGTLSYSGNAKDETKAILESIQEKLDKKPWYKKIFNIFKKEEIVEESEPMDALKFFSLVKASSKESAAVYRDRVSKYLTALHNATNIGQTALQEELIRGLITNKYESVLYAEGYYYAVTEEQVAKFASQCEKGLKLSYLKNFSRPIPQEVIDKVSKMNELEVFDNYVVLYYDPEGTVYKETAYEEAKRRDPIIFGVIAGSKKLYYVADWIDEYCDLTLDAFVDTLGIKKDDLHFDGEEIKKTKKRHNRKNKK